MMVAQYKSAARDATDVAVLYSRREGIQDTFGRLIVYKYLKQYRQPIWRVNGSHWSLPVIDEGLALGKKIQIASERIFAAVASNPFKYVLTDLIHVDVPTICGGFRDISEWDLVFLRLKNHLEIGGETYIKLDEVDKLVCRIKEHPVVHRAKFISTLDVDNLCRVLARITDVRWFIADRVHPDKLLRYFRQGLFGDNLIKCFDPRYRDAVNSWYNPFYHLAENDESQWWAPRDFLSRFYCEQLAKHASVDKAILKTTKKFLVFLFYNWLDCLYEDSGNSFFDHVLFFKHNNERSEWKQWLMNINQ